MAISLPSEADDWIAAWEQNLNDSAAYSEAGSGWGVGFNGDFLFEIRPDDRYDGEPVSLFVGLEDGDCTGAHVTEDPEGEDFGFAFRGDADDWKALIDGDLDPMEGMMDGRFDLEGDMQKVMQYSQAAIVMTENASKIDTEFEF